MSNRKNRYCYCSSTPNSSTQCLICVSLKQGLDFRTPNCEATKKLRLAITGTNGKTTLTNVLGTLLEYVYGTTAWSSSSGVRVSPDVQLAVEHLASEHYVYLLNQAQVRSVVSEQPEAGLAWYGLPIDHQIGIVTNITSDHLERPWVTSGIDDIFLLKSLVVRMATELAVTSVDYESTRRLVDIFDRGHFSLFGRDATQVQHYVQRGYVVCTVEDGHYVRLSLNEREVLAPVASFLLSLGGILDYNVENVLAILTALSGSERFQPKLAQLIRALQQIPLSFSVNPGRFNVMRYGETTVVLDYAHNEEGYSAALKSLTELAKRLNVSELIGLVGIASDRSQATITAISEQIGPTFDRVYVRAGNQNKNAESLIKALGNYGSSARWEQGYEAFIRTMAGPQRILYLTLAGHGNVNDYRLLIKSLALTDIPYQEIVDRGSNERAR